MLSRVSYTEFIELHEDERSSSGVGIRGLSGMEERRLLRVLDTTEEDVSEREEGLRSIVHTPLSRALLVWLPVSLLAVLQVVAVLVEITAPPLFKIPVTGLEIVAGLCLSRLRRRAGEACTRKVSKSAC